MTDRLDDVHLRSTIVNHVIALAEHIEDVPLTLEHLGRVLRNVVPASFAALVVETPPRVFSLFRPAISPEDLWHVIWRATDRTSFEIPTFDAHSLVLPHLGDQSGLEGTRPLVRAAGAGWNLVTWLPEGFALDGDSLELLDHYGRAAALVVSNANLHAEVQRIALIDELTGVFNRRYVQGRLDVELERAARASETTGLILADLDHFKTVNDRFGHLVGDATLRAVATELSRILRTYDLIGRFGDEEFVIIVPDTSLEGVTHLAERARSTVAALTVAGHNAPLSASFGVSVAVGGQPDADTLLRLADEALYLAKVNGRNRVEVSQPPG